MRATRPGAAVAGAKRGVTTTVATPPQPPSRPRHHLPKDALAGARHMHFFAEKTGKNTLARSRRRATNRQRASCEFPHLSGC